MATVDDLNAAVQAVSDAAAAVLAKLAEPAPVAEPVDFQPQVDSLTALAAQLQAAVA